MHIFNRAVFVCLAVVSLGFSQSSADSVIIVPLPDVSTSETVIAPLSVDDFYKEKAKSAVVGMSLGFVGMGLDYCVSLPMAVNGSINGAKAVGMVSGLTQFSGVMISGISASQASKSARSEAVKRVKFSWAPFIGGMIAGTIGSISAISASKNYRTTGVPLVMAVVQDGFFAGHSIHAVRVTRQLSEALDFKKQESEISVAPLILKNGGGVNFAMRF